MASSSFFILYTKTQSHQAKKTHVTTLNPATMGFPPFFKKPRGKSSRGHDQAEGSKAPQKRPIQPRTISHISLSSDWVTTPCSPHPSPSLPPSSPLPIPNPQESSFLPSDSSPLTSWVTGPPSSPSPPSPPSTKVKLYSYMTHLRIPHLDQNISYIRAHEDAIPETFRAECFQRALRFWEAYILPSSATKVWDDEITQRELEDLMIVGARLGHENGLPRAIRQRESFIALSGESKKQKMAADEYEDVDTCQDTTSDTDSVENDSDEEVPISASYQNLLGNRDPFDLPFRWGRAFIGREMVLSKRLCPTISDIEDEDYDALEGAYPDFEREREEDMELEMAILGWGHGNDDDDDNRTMGRGRRWSR